MSQPSTADGDPNSTASTGSWDGGRGRVWYTTVCSSPATRDRIRSTTRRSVPAEWGNTTRSPSSGASSARSAAPPRPTYPTTPPALSTAWAVAGPTQKAGTLGIDPAGHRIDTVLGEVRIRASAATARRRIGSMCSSDMASTWMQGSNTARSPAASRTSVTAPALSGAVVTATLTAPTPVSPGGRPGPVLRLSLRPCGDRSRRRRKPTGRFPLLQSRHTHRERPGNRGR